jgi:hypothetical protein
MKAAKNDMHCGSSYYCSAVLELPTPAYVKKKPILVTCFSCWKLPHTVRTFVPKRGTFGHYKFSTEK